MRSYLLYNTNLAENTPAETRPNWKWSNLSSFQKLMLIKVLRMDALMESCSTFVSLTLGDQFIASQEQSLNNLYKKSKPQYPILFILSPGFDLILSWIACHYILYY